MQEIQKELAEMRENFSALQAKWQNEKDAIGVVQKLREEIEDVNAEIEAAERKYDLNKAAELNTASCLSSRRNCRRRNTLQRKTVAKYPAA